MSLLYFVDQHSGALTFIITLVYAVTTCFILRANKKSADATLAQVEESKRQFEEMQRLQIVPSIQTVVYDWDEITRNKEQEKVLRFTVFDDENWEKCKQSYFFLSIENAGMGTAKSLKYEWTFANGKTGKGCFPVRTLYRKDSIVYCVHIGIARDIKNATEPIETKLTILFSDVLDRDYVQSIQFAFSAVSGNAVLRDSKVESIKYLGETTDV